MEESQINILNNKQMSRSGSHRYETHTKTNYENNEYIYLMGYITSSFLPLFSTDDFLTNHIFLWNIGLTSVQWN